MERDSAKVKDMRKDFKFKARLKDGSLPDYIVKELVKPTEMKTGRHAEQWKLMNSLFQKQNGKLIINLNDRRVEELKDW